MKCSNLLSGIPIALAMNLTGCSTPSSGAVAPKSAEQMKLTAGEVIAISAAERAAREQSNGDLSCYDFRFERFENRIQVSFSSEIEIREGIYKPICGRSYSILYDIAGKEILRTELR